MGQMTKWSKFNEQDLGLTHKPYGDIFILKYQFIAQKTSYSIQNRQKMKWTIDE